MKNGIPLKVEDYTCEGDQIYFIASDLYIIGKYNYQLDLINVLFNYSQTVHMIGAFTRIVKYHHKIYCIPCHAENIYCYNLLSEEFYSLNIPDSLFKGMPSRKIIEAVEVNGFIYCICRSPHLVLMIDAETDRYDIKYNNEITGEHEFFSLTVKDGCIIYPFFHNLIVSFDIEEKVFYTETLYDKDNQSNWNYIFVFCYDEKGYVWVCNFKGELYRIANKEIKMVEIREIHYGVQCMISKMFYKNGKIFLAMADVEGTYVLQYTISDEKFERLKIEQNCHTKRKGTHFDVCKISNSKLFIYRYDNNTFYIWNHQTESFNEFPVVLSGSIAANLQLGINYYESIPINLEFYIDYIKNSDRAETKDMTVEKESNGFAIYGAI